MTSPADPPAPLDAALLDVLLRSETFLSESALAERSGLRAAALRPRLASLQAAGCELESHPQYGLRLTRSGLGAWADYLEFVRGDAGPVQVYRETGSTQDACRRLVAANGPGADGTIALAGRQTAARGRLGRRWVSPAEGAVALSRVNWLGDERGGGAVERLTLAASVAVADAIERVGGGRVRPAIKWPNDVHLAGRKLAGILVETCHHSRLGVAAVVGVGVNVRLTAADLPPDEPDLAQRVTSLVEHGVDADRLLVAGELAAALDRCLRREAAADLLDRWRERCETLNERAVFLSDGRRVVGRAIDLDPELGLIVRSDEGQVLHLPAATTTIERGGV